MLHEGRQPSSGHYSAVVLHDSQWYHCNDMHVEAMQQSSALAPSATVYMCLYVRQGLLKCSFLYDVIVTCLCIVVSVLWLCQFLFSCFVLFSV